MTVTLKEVHWQQTGEITVDRIIDNEETLRDAVNDQEDDATDLVGFVNSYIGFSSFSFAVGSVGEQTIIAGDKHPDMTLSHVFAVVGSDNPLQNTTIEVLLNGGEALVDPIRVAASDTKGEVLVGSIISGLDVMRSDAVSVRSDTDQTVVLCLNFTSPD